MLPPRRSARPLLISAGVAVAVAGSLGYLVHVWPAPEPLPDLAPRPVAPTLVPINGPSDGQCLAFLDELVRHPHWRVTLIGGDERLTVDADGHALHTRGDAPARRLHLTPLKLRKLHVAAEASCAPRAGEGAMTITWGGPGSAGRTVPPSDAADQLADFLAASIAD